MTGFSQSLISGPFEKQIESSTTVRKPTTSYSPMLKTDALQMTQVKINATNQADAVMPQHSASQAESFSLTREGEHKNSASLLTSSFFFFFCVVTKLNNNYTNKIVSVITLHEEISPKCGRHILDGLTEIPTAFRKYQEPSLHPQGTFRDPETGTVAHYGDFNENRDFKYEQQIESHKEGFVTHALSPVGSCIGDVPRWVVAGIYLPVNSPKRLGQVQLVFHSPTRQIDPCSPLPLKYTDMIQQSHSWAYIQRKLLLERIHAPQCSLQCCLQEPRHGNNLNVYQQMNG